MCFPIAIDVSLLTIGRFYVIYGMIIGGLTFDMPKSDTKEITRTKKKASVRVKEPPMFRVILLNDHSTTMEFVVLVPESVFHKGPAEATDIMLSVHRNGAGVAGVYPKEVAETKSAIVQQLARENSFPLKCTLEPAQ